MATKKTKKALRKEDDFPKKKKLETGLIVKKKSLPVFNVGKDYARYPSLYGAPICGYLAMVTVEQAQCKEHNYPFNEGDTVFVFGDIALMPGHCVIATKDGKVHWAWHTDYFRPLNEEEI